MPEHNNSKNRGKIKMFGIPTTEQLETTNENYTKVFNKCQDLNREMELLKKDFLNLEKDLKMLQSLKSDGGDLSSVMNRLADLESKMGHLWDLLTHKNLKNETALTPAGNRFARRFGGKTVL